MYRRLSDLVPADERINMRRPSLAFSYLSPVFPPKRDLRSARSSIMAKSGKPAPKSIPAAPKAKAPLPKPVVVRTPTDWLARPAVEADLRLRRIFWGVALLGLVLLLALSFGSGINADDKFQVDYSQKLVSYYGTFGRDTAALNIPDGNMHLYGGAFEIVTGFANKAFGYQPTDMGYHHVRHAASALLGWVAMLCAALLARLIAGDRAGLITLIIMLVSPRFVGDALMNPKDIPFAAGYMLAIYNLAAVLSRLPRPRPWNVAGLVGGLALALAIRAGGLLTFVYVLLFAGLYFLLSYRSRMQAATPEQPGATLGRYALVVFGALVGGYVLALCPAKPIEKSLGRAFQIRRPGGEDPGTLRRAERDVGQNPLALPAEMDPVHHPAGGTDRFLWQPGAVAAFAQEIQPALGAAGRLCGGLSGLLHHLQKLHHPRRLATFDLRLPAALRGGRPVLA